MCVCVCVSPLGPTAPRTHRHIRCHGRAATAARRGGWVGRGGPGMGEEGESPAGGSVPKRSPLVPVSPEKPPVALASSSPGVGWVDGWTDRWMDEWMDGRRDGWMDGRMDGRMGGWIDG